MNYLDFLPDTRHAAAIRAIHDERQRWVNQQKKGFLRYRQPFEQLKSFRASHLGLDQDIVTIGCASEVSASDQVGIETQLRQFMPWRKGPFSVFGVEIDAEWRSERKWQRLAPFLPDLQDKVIADIGCNNGYYMFRMAAAGPRLVLGFEPTVQHYYCCRALQAMASQECLTVDLLGAEHLRLFPNCFDVLFLMGILYHRPSPIDTLTDIHTALRPGGTLILETQIIPGQEPVALFPEKTYAKVPGTYFVPTASCLRNWMEKCSFIEIDQFCSHPMSSAEQRRTGWMNFESYQDFIQPDRPEQTIEGYPAPWRAFLRAKKKN